LNTLWQTTLQRLIPSHLISRVVAYDWLASLVFMPIGYAVAGALAGSVLGVTPTLWLMAAIGLGLTIAVPLSSDLRHLELSSQSEALTPVVAERPGATPVESLNKPARVPD
jgi:hypothetical protein